MSNYPVSSALAADARDLPVGSRLIRSFLGGNYFYVLSACVFMAGCYMLMRSPLVAGTEFIRTLKSFLILQGYELLVIASAIVIVRKLKVLSDAVTLFLIEA